VISNTSIGAATSLGVAAIIAGAWWVGDPHRRPLSSLDCTTDYSRAPAGEKVWVVVVVEIIAFAKINPIAAMTGHAALLPSLNLVIIGFIFHRWRGCLMCRATTRWVCCFVPFRL
jgi:hypothetical protein